MLNNQSFNRYPSLAETIPGLPTHSPLERIAGSLPGALFQLMLSREGMPTFSYISDGILELLEIPVGRAMTDFSAVLSRIHIDDLDRFHASLMASAAQLQTWQLECRVVLPGYRLRWVVFLARPARQADGSVVWNGAALDITLHRQAERERQRELILRANLIVNVLDGVLLLSLQNGLNCDLIRSVGATLLERISAEAVHAVIVDLTEVQALDALAADALLLMLRAVIHLGRNIKLAGMRPQVIASLYNHGVELPPEQVEVCRTLALAVQECSHGQELEPTCQLVVSSLCS